MTGVQTCALPICGIRTPLLVKWPGKVQPGSGTDHISAFWDVLPTIAEIAGVEITVATDGISFLPTLLGKDQKQHQYLYWEFHEQGGKAALRMGDWKAVKRDIEKLPHGETELYDLQADIGETNNVAALYPDIVRKIDSLLIRARVRSQTFPFSCEVSPDMH